MESDIKYRLCQLFDEAIDHIISACPEPAKEQYIQRHDKVCAQLHFTICKEVGVKLEPWYENEPKLVETSHEGKVINSRNQQVHTDITFPNNKPDITKQKKKNRT
jgi:hypothetical protein